MSEFTNRLSNLLLSLSGGFEMLGKARDQKDPGEARDQKDPGEARDQEDQGEFEKPQTSGKALFEQLKFMRDNTQQNFDNAFRNKQFEFANQQDLNPFLESIVRANPPTARPLSRSQVEGQQFLSNPSLLDSLFDADIGRSRQFAETRQQRAARLLRERREP